MIQIKASNILWHHKDIISLISKKSIILFQKVAKISLNSLSQSFNLFAIKYIDFLHDYQL